MKLLLIFALLSLAGCEVDRRWEKVYLDGVMLEDPETGDRYIVRRRGELHYIHRLLTKRETQKEKKK